MSSGEAAAFATKEEAADALRALSQADLARLNALAKVRALRAPGLDWRELLHDAIDKLLTGKRQWPRDVPILVFMRQVMRSLASEALRKTRTGPVMIEADLPQGENGETDYSAALSDEPDAESQVHARQVLRNIIALFAGDKAVLAVIEGLSLGLPPEDVQTRHRLTPTQFASAQKRLRRSINRNYPNGQDQ